MSGKKFQIVPLTLAHGEQICQWRYDPPYSIYEFPRWEQMIADKIEFADPDIRDSQYAAVLDEVDVLAGFAQFFPMQGVTRLGLGLRPDWCGQGLGSAFVQAIAKDAHVRTPTHEIDLEVLVWNERARKVYEQCGFVVTDTYERNTPSGPDRFHCMVYQHSTR